MKTKLIFTLVAAAVLLIFGSPAQADIILGAISNRTGPTSDSSIPHTDGVLHAYAWINSMGGIKGQKIKLIEIDCSYAIPKTVAAFKRLVETEKVPLVHGFGTPDSMAIIPFSTRTQTIYMPLSYAKEFSDAKNAPYYFTTNSTYNDAGRSAVQFVKKQGGKLALLYNNGGFGLAPIADIKDEAKKLGVPIVADEHSGYAPTDVVQPILKFKEAGADYIWMGNTTSAMTVLAKDLKKQGFPTKAIGNIYAATEAFIRNAGPDAEGHYSMYGGTPYGAVDTPAMKQIMASTYFDKLNTDYIRGWAQALLVAEVVKITLDANKKLTGPNLKAAFETLKDFTPGGLIPPVTFTADDHRPSMVVPVYQVQGGKMVKVWDNRMSR